MLNEPVTLREIIGVTTFSGLALLFLWLFFTGKIHPASTMDRIVALFQERLAEKDKLIDRANAGWEAQTKATDRLADMVEAFTATLGRRPK